MFTNIFIFIYTQANMLLLWKSLEKQFILWIFHFTLVHVVTGSLCVRHFLKSMLIIWVWKGAVKKFCIWAGACATKHRLDEALIELNVSL